MEAARDTARNATNAILQPVRNTNTDAVTDTASQATDAAGNATGTNGKSATAALINSAPFSSFKPDPSMVWKGHLIYVILAAGCTLPWWAFVLAVDYFQFLYPGSHIIRYFAFAYFGSWLLCYLLVANFWREGSSWVKINVGGGVSIVMLLVIPLLDGIFMESRGTTATFWVTLVAVAIAGAADAVSQGSLLGISSELPESFTKAYCCGAAVSGVFVYFLRIITKASFSDSMKGLRISGIVYFSLAALFLVLVLALFAYIHYMPEMGYYNSLNLGSFETVRLLIQEEGTVTIEVASSAAIAAVAAGRSSPALPLNWLTVLNRVKLLSSAMFISSCVSLTIFPGVLAENVHHWARLGDWSPLLLMGTYVMFDLFGRLYLVTFPSMTVKHSTVFGTAWIRLVMVALFILALLFDPSIILMIVITAILGFSNGYLIATLTVLVPKANPASDAETAGILNALTMTIGVLVGAGLSWIFLVV